MEATNPQTQTAIAHLQMASPQLAAVIAQVGSFTLQRQEHSLRTLVRAILSQQISTKAAASIQARLEALMPEGVIPEALLSLSPEQLRAAGLSRAKVVYIHDLAARVARGDLKLDRLPDLPDEAVIQQLIAVKGIGRWTAEMFLIFSLGRLDVWPVDDLGVRVAVQRLYSLPERPGKKELLALAEPWRPYRSVATWYLWRSLVNNIPIEQEPGT